MSSIIDGAALVAEILLDLFQLLDDHAAQLLFGTQNVQILGDLPLNIRQFVQNFLLLHAGQALQLQFDNRLRLPLAEARSATLRPHQLGVLRRFLPA